MSGVIDRLMTIKDLAEAFSVTERTIDNWVASGKFPAPVTVGSRLKRWHPSVIEQYRFGHDTPPAENPAEQTPELTEEEKAMEYFSILDPLADDESLMQPEEVCLSLHCSIIDLYRIVEAGQLPVVVTENRHRRFKTRDVFAYQSTHMDDIYRRLKTEQFMDRNPDLEVA